MNKKMWIVFLVTMIAVLQLPLVVWAADTAVEVGTYSELVAAAARDEIQTIKIVRDIDLDNDDTEIIINRAITIEGNNHVITGNSIGRVFSITASSGEIVVNNLTVKNSHNPNGSGGALYLIGNATLTSCHFLNNSATSSAQYGGAIFHDGEISMLLSLNACTFTENTTEAGGAVYSRINAHVTDCTFINNQAACGGGLFVRNSIKLKNCLFDGNTALADSISFMNNSGAIATDGAGVYFEIDSCAFYNNAAGDNGGVTHSFKDILLIGDNYFVNNSPAGVTEMGISFGSPGGLTRNFTPDSTGNMLPFKAGTIHSVIPDHGALSVPTSGNIIITFFEAMDSTAGDVTLTDGQQHVVTIGNGTWSDDNKTYTVSYSGLNYNTNYSIGVGGFKTAAGLSMNTEYGPYAFTTRPAVPAVTGISIIPERPTVKVGGTQQFKTTVTVEDGADAGVTWSITGAKSAATKLSEDGLLTVGADETASELAVTATSIFDKTQKATIIVQVAAGETNNSPQTGDGANISIYILLACVSLLLACSFIFFREKNQA